MNSSPRFLRQLTASRTACVLALLAALPAGAQERGAPADDEIVELSPFTVNTTKDIGYLAADTLSGGRLNTNLLETPADITVLTREFLDDLAVYNLDEANAWLTNASVNHPDDDNRGDRDFGGNVTFRGLRSGGTTRNYFAYHTTPQSYIVDRIEGSRGPNSIVYGAGGAGGQVNVLTKRAVFRNFTNVTARLDSERSQSTMIDVGARLSRQFALRFNGLAQRQRTWLDGYYDDRYAGAVALTFRPWRTGELRFDGEHVYTKKQSYGYIFSDYSSLWDRVTVVDAPGTSSLAAAGLQRESRDRLVSGHAFNGVLNFNGFARTMGTGLTVVDQERPFSNFPILPRRSFRITPPESNIVTHEYTAALFFEQQLPLNIVLELAGTVSAMRRDAVSAQGNNTYVDVNRVMPYDRDGDGRLDDNPRRGEFYSEGETSFLNNDEFGNALRAAIAWPWVTRWFNQTISAVAQRRAKVFDPETYFLGRTNGSVVNPRDASNQVFIRRYWDEAGSSLVIPESGNGYQFDRILTRELRRNDVLEALQFNTVGKYFGNRLHLVAGIRFDQYKVNSREATFDTNSRPNGHRIHKVNDSATTSSAGIVWFPLRQLGVFFNYSEGFTPQMDENPWVGERGQVYTTASEGVSGGIRFRLFGEKVVGSVGYYKSKEKDLAVSVSRLRTQVNALWTDVGRPEMYLDGPFSVISDTVDNKGTGYEVDLTANLTSGFRLKFNLAIPETEQSNSLPDIKAYFARYVPVWEAGITDPSSPYPSRIREHIDVAENSIASFTDGRPLNGTIKWNANIFGNYRFNTGALKGLRLGGGVNFYGKRIIGSPTDSPYTLIHSDDYYLLSAMAGYAFKIAGVQLDLTLNVTNVLDYSDPVFKGVTVYNNITYRDVYSYIEPRKFLLTATFKF